MFAIIELNLNTVVIKTNQSFAKQIMKPLVLRLNSSSDWSERCIDFLETTIVKIKKQNA